jgi:CubicO group peptidase (beta-lactamase class C family)
MDGAGRVAGLSRRAVLPATAPGAFAPRALHAQPIVATNLPRNIEEILPALEGIVGDAMRRSGVAGMAVAVEYQDRAVFLRGFGARPVGMPEPVDADTVFPLASLSKPLPQNRRAVSR